MNFWVNYKAYTESKSHTSTAWFKICDKMRWFSQRNEPKAKPMVISFKISHTVLKKLRKYGEKKQREKMHMNRTYFVYRAECSDMWVELRRCTVTASVTKKSPCSALTSTCCTADLLFKLMVKVVVRRTCCWYILQMGWWRVWKCRNIAHVRY